MSVEKNLSPSSPAQGPAEARPRTAGPAVIRPLTPGASTPGASAPHASVPRASALGPSTPGASGAGTADAPRPDQTAPGNAAPATNPATNPATTPGPNPAAAPAANPGPNPGPGSGAGRKPGKGPGGGAVRGRPPKPRQAAAQLPVRPTARPARLKRRHIAVALSFVLLVLLPSAVSAWYLWNRAADQYASYLGFSVRSESGATPGELLGGLSSLVGISDSAGSDTDILYKFIQSRDLVERVNARLDLAAIWSKAPDDPVFSYRGNGALEDLLKEWQRKVRIYYDGGMIDLRVLAFDPKDAQDIAQAILDESTLLINQLNDVAREDALRYSRQELELAQQRLKEARQAITEFRNRHQLVDPSADVQGQVGVVTSLQQQLAELLVQLGLLKANAQPGDPRIEQAELRIRTIREQIDAERRKFGSETASGEPLSEVVGQYETLAVDREFAERSYTAALAAHEAARMDAARQSRYLAAYVKPTLAQLPEFPERGKTMVILIGFLLTVWIIGVLIFYSLRDRR